MMNIIQKGIIIILKSAITGEKYNLPDNFNLEEAATYIARHNIEPLIYIGALNCGITKENPFMQVLFGKYCNMLLYSERQTAEIERIYNAFDENNIDYMPVKGCNMKALYPHPEMRVMGDADILIKIEQYEKVEQIMTELGFNFISKGDHDYAWRSENLHVELHYLLMYAYNEVYGNYFGNGWNRAYGHEGNKYYMSDEDDFIYQFIHFTKHYRIGGIGCRHVVDLWVYLRTHIRMNFNYIEETISRLSVKEFYNNTMNLIEVWFNNGEQDAIIEYMTQFIFESGSWGTLEHSALAAGVKEIQDNDVTPSKGKNNIIKSIVFPSASALSSKYKILKSAPLLLPVIWIIRWVDVFLFRSDNIKLQRKKIKSLSSDSITEYEKNLKLVGLDFKFNEKE